MKRLIDYFSRILVPFSSKTEFDRPRIRNFESRTEYQAQRFCEEKKGARDHHRVKRGIEGVMLTIFAPIKSQRGGEEADVVSSTDA
jgi:hypothetical protein